MDNKKINELIQSAGALGEYLRIMYLSLTKAGFTNTEALFLVAEMLKGMVSGPQGSKE